MKRIGGGYGSKISRQHVVSTAAAVAAWKLRQPVRVVVDLNTNMTYAGWREPYLAQYEVRECLLPVFISRFVVCILFSSSRIQCQLIKVTVTCADFRSGSTTPEKSRP